MARQVELLNTKIREINNSLGQNTLNFNQDIKRRRKDTGSRKNKVGISGIPGVRTSYKYSVYYDGLHANTDLAQVWLRKLRDDINRHCFSVPEEDIVDLTVSEEDILSLQ